MQNHIITKKELLAIQDAMKIDQRLENQLNSAIDKILLNLNLTKIRLQLAQGTYTEPGKVSDTLRKLTKEVEQLKISEHKICCVPYYWITINPPPKYWDARMPEGAQLFGKYIQKISTWKNVALTAHIIEQREEIPCKPFRGLHCHLLIKTRQCQDEYELKRALKRKFKALWTVQTEVDAEWAVNNYHLLNIQRCRNDWVNDKIQYLLGKKWDDDKIAKLECDIKFREFNDIHTIIDPEWIEYGAEIKEHFMAKAKVKTKKKINKRKKKKG